MHPELCAATPRNLALAYNVTGPEAVGGAPNVFATSAATTGAAETSVTASLGRGMYVGNLVVPPSAVTSPPAVFYDIHYARRPTPRAERRGLFLICMVSIGR